MWSVILPVLNEVENLKVLLPQLLRPDCEVIVCDNGSTDGSVRVVEDALPSFSIRLSKGGGSVSSAIFRGLKLATSDRIVVMDSDLSHPPEIVYRLASSLEECDMVIGSRYMKGGSTRDTLRNRVISWGLNILTFGLAPGVADRSSGLWGIRRSLVGAPVRNTVKPMLEFLVRADPLSVGEVPYTFRPRVNGRSKIGKPYSKTLVDVFLLYLHKYRRFIRYLVVGGAFTAVVFLGTYLITELGGLWYLTSLAIMVALIEVGKFMMLGSWAFGGEKSSSSPDYEWDAWYRGNLLQKWWKRKIGYITKEFLGSPRRLLDIGCGSSPVINLFHCERTGVDRDKGKVGFLSGYTTARLVTVDIERDGLPGDSFDGILCNNVLEHLESPQALVEEISRKLSVGGKAVITIPDEGSLVGRIGDWLYRRFGSYGHDHCTRLTAGALDSMCETAGLRLVGRRKVLTDTVRCYTRLGV